MYFQQNVLTVRKLIVIILIVAKRNEDKMEETLHYLIMANHMMIQKSLMERVKNTGLTLGQPKVLDFLKDHDGISQKEIAQGCYIEAASLTSILNRMEEKGLIERRMLNGNRRTLHVFMTEEGKKKQQLVEQTFSEVEKQILADISQQDYEQFMQICYRMYCNLNSMMKEGKEKNE